MIAIIGSMTYTEVTFTIEPLDPWRDILIAELSEAGYEGFEETSQGLRAYMPSSGFDRAALKRSHVLTHPHAKVTHTVREVEQRNWNAEWESSFQPVEVEGRVRIRAEFHPFVPGFEHDIIITPRMAFGTGHHATTRMMIQAMLQLDLRGKSVCDLGCGTGVLAILAERLGAAGVQAIDIDEGAVENARAGLVVNGCHRIHVEKGTAALLRPESCAAILANIERNTLMNDMKTMAAALLPGGALLLSGFSLQDGQMMAQCAKKHGLTVVEHLQEGEWALIGCRK